MLSKKQQLFIFVMETRVDIVDLNKGDASYVYDISEYSLYQFI